MFWLSVALAGDWMLIGTAGSGGVGSGRVQLTLPTEALAAVGVQPDAVSAGHSAMLRGRQALWADDGRTTTVEAFVANPGRCGEPDRVAVIEGRNEVLFVPHATAAGPFELSRAETVAMRRCEGPQGAVWWVGEGLPPADIGDFEHRLSLDVRAGADRLWAVGRPHQEFARRVAYLESLVGIGAFWLDGGDFVDGPSTVDPAGMSRHRPLGFDTLKRLKPTVAVPGAAELAVGPAAFLKEGAGIPYVAANWITDVPELQLPPLWRGEIGGDDVAVIGIIDPVVGSRIPGLAEAGVVLADPVSTAQTAVDALADDPPNIVIVLGAWRPDVLAELQKHLVGVDILIGDPAPAVDRVDTVDVSLQEPFGGEDHPPITFPVQGVTWATLRTENGELTGLSLRPTAITPAIDPDEEALRRITAVRREAYAGVSGTLMPAPAGGPLATWTEADWRKVLCEAVLEHTGADFAFLPELPPPPGVPGPLTDKLVLDQLPLLDLLVGRHVLGDRLQRVSDKAFEVVPVACGIEPGATVLVGGRPADLQRLYRVVTTDRMLASGPVGALVAEAAPTRLLDRPEWSPPGPMALAGAARAGLVHADGDTNTLLARSPATKTPLWLLRFTRVSLSAARFQGVEDERYAEIPETLATSPSSLTLLADADAGLEYSDARLAWDVRQRLIFTRLAIEAPGAPTEVSEPADDWRSSSSLTVPAWGFTVGSLWAPYTELLLDSELTAVEEEDGATNPQQADLSLTLGLSTSKGVLKLLRVGGFGLRDLSVLGKPWELGGRAEVSTSVPLGAGLAWTSTLDGFVFADTAQTDASDLRFKALVDSRLSLAFTRWLSLAPYGQAFAFAGRATDTSQPAVAVTFGTSLDLAGALR